MKVIPMKVVLTPDEVREMVRTQLRATTGMEVESVHFDITCDSSQRDGDYNHRLGSVTVEAK